MAVVDVDVVVEVEAGVMDHDVDPVASFTFDDQITCKSVGACRADHHGRGEAGGRSRQNEDAAEHRHAGRKGKPDDLIAGESAVVFDLLRHVCHTPVRSLNQP